MTTVGTKEEIIAEIERLQKAYHLTFQLNQPANIEVLEDLGRFCRANETCAVPGDHDKTFMLLGRNELWLRIQQFLNLTPEQLFALYARDASKFRSEK
jgi:hypothetical protein